MARWQVNGKQIKDESAEQTINEEPIVAAVRDALEQLPAAAREVLYLHYFSGLSHEEIAQSLGVSSQAVHGRMQRARRILAGHLANDD